MYNFLMKMEYIEILKKSSILLVDDNTNLRNKFKEALYIFVDNIYEAENGDEALELYKKFNPNIIITDVKMPMMDGLMLTTVIRKLDRDVPIIVISAYNEIKTLMDFISLNLIEYLVKPIDFEQLTEILKKCAKIILEKGLIEVKLTENAIYSYSKKSLIINNELITLTPKEITFLELLIKNRDKLITKEVIEDIVYNGEEMSISALNNLTSKIRKKISKNIIATISNTGFILTKEY